ncbi:MAG: Hint domain-containing protein [Pararhodobacter sp.]
MLHLFDLHSAPQPMTGRGSRPMGVASGTLIRTADGDIPVEYLCAGDRVLTRGNGFQTLRSVGVIVARDIDVVRFAARALGRKEGARALTVPVAQQVLVRDWRAQIVYGKDSILTPAGSLVDDKLARRQRLDRLRLFQLHFDTPQVIWANGAELASTRALAAAPRRHLH